jgi:hypothetical protein
MDISKTIAPKSDQLNADDLIGRSLTIKVRDVKGNSDAAQPVSIFFDGDDNKPYKPCKSMRRLLVTVWGSKGQDYIGKSMTLYRDDSVIFAGQPVGGIRISHVSDITDPMQVLLTVNRASRKPYTVQPLQVAKKEELTPNHPKWGKAKQALKDCKTTLEAIKKSFELNEINETKLTQNE